MQVAILEAGSGAEVCSGFGGDGVAVGGFLGACFGVSSESQASSPGVLTTPISSYVCPA